MVQGLEDEGGGDPEVVFKREVVETLLRTMLLAKESESAKTSMMENAVIELNALKIAGALSLFHVMFLVEHAHRSVRAHTLGTGSNVIFSACP